jgi:hypothetical protein
VPPDPTIAYGILKCRDLVQLYYGARLVASIIENSIGLNPGAIVKLLGQDPRRVRYEIILANTTAAAASVGINASQDAVSNIFSTYAINAGDTLIIDRNFFTDLDAVTLSVWAEVGTGSLNISTRETFLTPAPVDEGP